MQKRFIVGTSGHIDHGKSTLVHALTGVDPDRLAEEKRRGITIELGFAKLDIDEMTFGIIDVPGHEKFVRTMVAGAAGIDIVMLVIAADEGVMPQTREHLDICNLLGTPCGLIVLTKCDLVEEEWLALVREDIRDTLQGSFLEEAPILAVSSQTGEGLETLRQTLYKLAQEQTNKPRRGYARLPIDRVFEQRGFGPVVTGTLYAGRLREGDSIALLPTGQEGKIRGLQVHGASVSEALAGQRTAINLQGIPLNEIHRGQVVVHANELAPTHEIAVRIHLLSHVTKPLKHGTSLLFHAGTVQVLCRIWFLNRKELLPGTQTYARIRLDTPTILLPGDHFILRGFQRIEGYGNTVGGGTLLDPFPPSHKRRDIDHESRLEQIETLDPSGLIALLAQESGRAGIELAQLRQRSQIPPKAWDNTLAKLRSQGILIQFRSDPSPMFLHKETLTKLLEHACSLLQTYHQTHPLEAGMSRETLREQVQITPPRLFQLLLQKAEQKKVIVVDQDHVRLPNHRVRLQQNEATIEQNILQLYLDAQWTPPRARDLPKSLDFSEKEIRPILDLLTRRGDLKRIQDDLYFHQEALQQLQNQLVQYLQEHQTITAQQFKQMTNASRKFTIPLAEYFDKQKVTVRYGEERQLYKHAQRS